MPVDYSKWDALELSDDSDIEVHPNVDKRSFIRAKQNQIHQDRFQRKHETDTLKYERIINDGVLARIDALLSALKRHTEDANTSTNADQLVFQSMMESAGSFKEDKPPPRPEGVHTQVKDDPTYAQMMASLIDQVKKAVDERKPEHRLPEFTTELQEHRDRVAGLQQDLLARLAELEKLDKSKITSDNIRTGFDTSHVSKNIPSVQSNPASSVQLLNPKSNSSNITNNPLDSGSEADVEDETPDSTHNIQPSALGNAFAKLPPNDYRAYLQFIVQNPAVLAERETDGLLLQAFDLQSAGSEAQSKQAVHQALLLQYCRSLGQDGVALFFKRITTKDHQARKMFFDDVNSTYVRLRDKSREFDKAGAAEDAGVEQIQLHAVNPGQKINIVVPAKTSDASSEEEAQARNVFESFPPGLQRALESGELDEVNKVLGKMSVDEAEEVVGQLGEGGMLSLEEGIVDATTEEGQQRVKEIEEYGLEEEEKEEEEEQRMAVDEVD